MKKILLAFITVFISFASFSQGKFNKVLMTEYAILGLEEVNKASLDNYDLKTPRFLVKKVIDCENNFTSVLLVSFAANEKAGSASIYISLTKKNHFDKFLKREFIPESSEATIESFKNSKKHTDLMGCGL